MKAERSEINQKCADALYRLGMKMPERETADSEEQTEEWLNEVTGFIRSYDFMRLGMAITHKQWQGAAMNIRRMDMQAKKVGAECFARQFTGLKQNIAGRNVQECKQILASVTARRVKIIEVLNERERQFRE